MQAITFNHLALAVKDVVASIEFYQTVFGLEEIENTASNSETRWLSLAEGKELHLIPRTDVELKMHKTVHFAMAIEDIEPFIAHLKRLKINYFDWSGEANKFTVRKDGIKQVYFQDPNEYWVEVNDAKTVG